MLILLVAASTLAGCAAPIQQRDTARSAIQSASPIHLVGATSASLRTSLVPPVLRRRDGSAEVWLYDSQTCRLEIVLYPGAGGGKLVSLAQPMPRTVHLSACMASLRRGGTS